MLLQITFKKIMVRNQDFVRRVRLFILWQIPLKFTFNREILFFFLIDSYNYFGRPSVEVCYFSLCI